MDRYLLAPGTPLPFERAENFRQLGGYAGAGGKYVRQGVFYRSGALCEAVTTPHDRELLESLGLKVIFDFRSLQEKRQMPDPDVPGARRVDFSAIQDDSGRDVNFDIASFFSMPADELEQTFHLIRQGYAQMPFGNRAYRALFDAMLEGEVPLLFHCTAGKDRTGVAAMLILRTLGVSDADIMADYLKTNECRMRTRAALTEKFRAALGGQMDLARRRMVDLMTGVEADGLRMSMEAIDRRYPAFADYLQAEYSIGPAQLERLRAMYLEDADSTAGQK